MSKAQRDPIRNSISPQALQGKSFALSPIWKDPIMQDPAVKRLMKKMVNWKVFDGGLGIDQAGKISTGGEKSLKLTQASKPFLMILMFDWNYLQMNRFKKHFTLERGLKSP